MRQQNFHYFGAFAAIYTFQHFRDLSCIVRLQISKCRVDVFKSSEALSGSATLIYYTLGNVWGGNSQDPTSVRLRTGGQPDGEAQVGLLT